MSTSTADDPGDTAGWWESPAVEQCAFCENHLAVEVFIHCIDCDRPVCPFCAVTIRERRGLRCPECDTERGRG
jgi:ferredoxin